MSHEKPIMPEIITARTTAQYEAAKVLFKEYSLQLGIDLCFQNFDKELANIEKKYGPPTGELWLLEDNGNYVGCAAIWQLEEGVCEVKRMYLRKEYRGQNWGEKLLQTAIDTAKKMGYQTIKLDTLARLTPAVGLYKKFGFEQTFPYNFNPENDVMYFQKAV